MIVYLDTSALVPLLIREPATDACGELWDGAANVVVTRLVPIEATAALETAQRMGRITTMNARGGRAILDELWHAVDVIELDQELMWSAARLATAHGLRGYDATHCAAALATSDPQLVAASGDAQLLAAWQAEGVATRDVNA